MQSSAESLQKQHKISIVYHSGYGHTEVIAEAVHRGAVSEGGVDVHIFTVDSVDWEVLNRSDAIIFGSPTYMGSVSAPFKDFMDKTGKVWLKQEWKDKLSAGFTNAGSPSGDKLNVLIQLAVFAAQHSMTWINLGFTPHNHIHTTTDEHGVTTEEVVRLNRLGGYLGVMAQSTNDSPDVTPPIDDILTAEHFGKRIATMTKIFKSGQSANAVR
jgi:NAD(P)H dehydrogenase (quinone)